MFVCLKYQIALICDTYRRFSSDSQDNFLPPNERNNYDCEKEATGPLNRKKLIEHINKQAIETPDVPELEPYVKGKVRGKKVMGGNPYKSGFAKPAGAKRIHNFSYFSITTAIY